MSEYIDSGVTGTTKPDPWRPKNDDEENNNITWSQWHLYTESIDVYDQYNLKGLGTIISTDDTNGHKWQLNFKSSFIMGLIGTNPYPIKFVYIQLSKVLKYSDKLIELIDTDGVKWSASDYPNLKEVGKVLPSNHPLSTKIANNVGTFVEVCTWKIPIDDIDSYKPVTIVDDYYSTIFTAKNFTDGKFLIDNYVVKSNNVSEYKSASKKIKFKNINGTYTDGDFTPNETFSSNLSVNIVLSLQTLAITNSIFHYTGTIKAILSLFNETENIQLSTRYVDFPVNGVSFGNNGISTISTSVQYDGILKKDNKYNVSLVWIISKDSSFTNQLDDKPIEVKIDLYATDTNLIFNDQTIPGDKDKNKWSAQLSNFIIGSVKIVEVGQLSQKDSKECIENKIEWLNIDNTNLYNLNVVTIKKAGKYNLSILNNYELISSFEFNGSGGDDLNYKWTFVEKPKIVTIISIYNPANKKTKTLVNNEDVDLGSTILLNSGINKKTYTLKSDIKYSNYDLAAGEKISIKSKLVIPGGISFKDTDIYGSVIFPVTSYSRLAIKNKNDNNYSQVIKQSNWTLNIKSSTYSGSYIESGVINNSIFIAKKEKYLKKDINVTITYDLLASVLGLEPNKPFTQNSTIPEKDGFLQKNEYYFIKVLPLGQILGSISDNKLIKPYIVLNSNDKVIETTNGLTSLDNNTYNYRKGEGVQLYNKPQTILKNTIDDSSNYETDQSINESVIISNYNVTNRYSPLAWFKTPSEDYINKTHILIRNKINSWVDPDKDEDGYWYQLYDSWALNNNIVSVRSKDNDNNLTFNENKSSPNPTGYNTLGQGGHFDSTYNNYNLSKYLKVDESMSVSYPIHYYFNNIFEKEYNYQFIVKLPKFNTGTDLKITTPWQDKLFLNTFLKSNSKTINYNIFSNINSFRSLIDQIEENNYLERDNLTNEYKIVLPIEKPINRVISSTNPKNPITFTANTNFNNGMGIQHVILYKTKWFLQGYAAYSTYDTTTNYIKIIEPNSTGWHYNAEKSIFTYLNTNLTYDYPFGGNVNDYFSNKTQDEKYINNNFICRYIKVQKFNLNFDYTNNSNNISIDIYTGIELPNGNLPNLISTGLIKKVGTINKSNKIKQNCEYIGLDGNQYLFIVVNGITNITEQLVIENLKIEGEYHKLNNTLFKNLDTTYKDNQNNIQTSYSIKLGTGNNVDPNAVNDIYIINSKIGNSNFVSGIWETGVWQSGWRESKQYSFIDLDQFYSYDSDKKWRFIVSGNRNTSDFNIGDKVSISNIVVIDINGDRRLIKNYFTIVEKTETKLIVEFFYDFPIRSIEKDSENHLIIVTKSIWLNGVFLNGRFKGNWIDGIFKGFPFITKMEESHWVDGTFEGGHFKSDIIKYTFSNINNSDNVYIIINTQEENNFNINDSFYLYDVNNNKIWEREFKVLTIINSQSFYSDIRKDDEILFDKVKYLVTTKNSGLIQNIDFNSNNTSDKTISKSFISEYIFSYNSWLDLVYDTTSATNILKPQNIPNNTGNLYSENNLYGYISYDILSSVSKFRDSFSNTIREYKLGMKWKVFHDYVGETSTFDEYFHSVYTPKKTSEQGWSFNVSNNILSDTSRFIGYRTDDKDEDITGKELKIVAEGDGGVLNLDNKTMNNIPFRYTEKIKSLGYSIASFDLISSNTSLDNYTKGVNIEGIWNLKSWYNGTFSKVDSNAKYEPVFSFSNINQTSITKNGEVLNTAMTYLPVYQNINHLKTKNKTKIEYFFNKKDLMLSLKGSGTYGTYSSSIVIDNLQFYEVDMIPFFQYFNIENINKGIQIPNGIDYIRFNYNTLNNNYNYVSYTNIKTFEYFKSDNKFWLEDNNSLININTDDFFNKNI